MTSLEERAGGALLAYIEAARPVQETLRQVLTQVAGCSLMIMTRSKPAMRPDAAMELARSAAAHAHEAVRALSVPAAAAHHFHHLRQASEALGWAFRAAGVCMAPGAGESDREDLIRALKAATEHLRATAGLLPGFEIVDFGQACCALHGGPQPSGRAG